MYLTEKEYNIALDGYAFIDDAVKKFAEEYDKEFCKGWLNKVEFFPLPDGSATIDIEEEYSYCGCCSNDYETHELPVDYLWDEHWVGREKERRAERVRKAERDQEEKKKIYKEEQEEKRYAKFLAMKEEYESEDNV